MKGNHKAVQVDNDIKNNVKETWKDAEYNETVNDDQKGKKISKYPNTFFKI